MEECIALPPSRGAAELYCEPQACFYSWGVMWGALVNHSPNDRERNDVETERPGLVVPLVANTEINCVQFSMLGF